MILFMNDTFAPNTVLKQVIERENVRWRWSWFSCVWLFVNVRTHFNFCIATEVTMLISSMHSPKRQRKRCYCVCFNTFTPWAKQANFITYLPFGISNIFYETDTYIYERTKTSKGAQNTVRIIQMKALLNRHKCWVLMRRSHEWQSQKLICLFPANFFKQTVSSKICIRLIVIDAQQRKHSIFLDPRASSFIYIQQQYV